MTIYHFYMCIYIYVYHGPSCLTLSLLVLNGPLTSPKHPLRIVARAVTNSCLRSYALKSMVSLTSKTFKLSFCSIVRIYSTTTNVSETMAELGPLHTRPPKNRSMPYQYTPTGTAVRSRRL